ncbi:MAG: FecR/PupR family sigma factor regulator, partial [Chloroflexota bacterium]
MRWRAANEIANHERQAKREQDRLLRRAFGWRNRLEDDNIRASDKKDFQRWLAQDYRHEEAFERAKTYVAAFDYLRAENLEPQHLKPLLIERVSSFLINTRSFVSRPKWRFSIAAFAVAIIIMPVVH